jgi:hypothetical protein
VHATQFAIRDVGLYQPVLELAMQTALQWQPLDGARPLVMIAGLAGPLRRPGARPSWRAVSATTRPAEPGRDEGRQRRRTGGALPAGGGGDAAGGLLPAGCGRRHRAAARFWRRFAAIDNVVAIKTAPFNRYRTLDVIRGVVEAGAEERMRSTPATTTTSCWTC